MPKCRCGHSVAVVQGIPKHLVKLKSGLGYTERCLYCGCKHPRVV